MGISYYLPLPTDWPGFYYHKKLIAQGKEKRTATIIPEQGQFHVYLNAVEDVVLIFKFFFDEMYKAVFGGILANKPKPYRSTLCVTATFLRLSLVRAKYCQNLAHASLMSLFQSYIFLSTLCQ